MGCTGVRLARFSVMVKLFSPYPVIPAVIRLSRGRLLPASRPAGHIQRTTNPALPPTLNQYSHSDCPAGHQPTPEIQYSINAVVRMHCVASTNACSWILDLILLAETCSNVQSLLLFPHVDCHPRGRSPR
ncbi:hypothetical protein LF1_57750 [Rubripirellula obstinata]|uniref:Uncharacterized protein n=1 Tax=Rubripirellula obstinata TaxID=406547 RepID=A0A5B1C9P9_9BACT|nr:hypothetical protein LF1_57750 [Rubripirellula obstinata]